MDIRHFSFSIILLFLLNCIPSSAICQAPEEDVRDRYSFAEMYLGVDLLGVPYAGQTFYRRNAGSSAESYSIGSHLTPRLLIGGTHFWGHADFFVYVPVSAFGTSNDRGLEISYQPGVETGAVIYPWKLQKGGVRPYAGVSWSMIRYQQTVWEDQKGPSLNLSRVSLQAGIGWRNKTGLWEAGISYLPRQSFRYPLSRNQFETVTLPRWSFRVSYKYLFDTTGGYREKAPGGKIPERVQQHRKSETLSAFSIALGYSGAFTLSPSSHNRQNHPYLDNSTGATPFPDLSAGYYWFEPDASVRFSWRSIRQSQKAFGVDQRLYRRSFALDVLKFLGDYHGFVPFIGPFLSHEFLRAKEFDGEQQILNRDRNLWTAGIVFGWDIRPIRTPGVILRTNLRYTPRLSLETAPDQQIRFNQLEVNFIQVVLYPERLLD